MTYLSSMEIYGTPLTDDLITENSYNYMDHMSTRSSYPESKKWWNVYVRHIAFNIGCQ